MAARLVGDEEARDVAQDLAVVALQKFESFDDESHLAAWALTRARWLSLDRLKVQRRRLPLNAVGRNYTAETPENAVLAEEIQELLERLPRRQRVALELTAAGFSVGEIARELGVREATVRSLRRHARYRLLRNLDLGSPNP